MGSCFRKISGIFNKDMIRMKRKLFVLMPVMLLAVWLAGAQQSVKGYVFEDVNANGKRDRKEAGIAGVGVSNGREVVLTDPSGKYILPIGSDDIVFVVKPTGYQTPVSANQLSKFYYIHKPQGSPSLKFAGVPPTGNLPASVDFPLYRSKEGEDFEILLFGDPQAYNKNELRYFDQRIVSELAGNVDRFAFGISVGDLVGDNPNLFVPYVETIKKIGIPWYNVVGNHDLNHDAQTDQQADESYEQVFGPSTYSFNHGKAHFIIIKDILWPDPRDGKGYWGGFTEEQLAFLKSDLKLVPKDYLVVMAFHIPIWEGYVKNDIFRDADREKLFELLKDFPHTLTISAHSHIQYNKFLSKEEGWKQDQPHHHLNLGTTCGSWYRGELDENGIPWSVMADGTPQGYAIMKVSGNRYEIGYKAAGFSAGHQMRVHHPKIVGKAEKTLASLYVNFFMGSEKDQVRFRVDGGAWKPMSYTIEWDPAYLNLLHQWDMTDEVIPGRRPNEPRECLHLWKAPLPSNLAPGEHVIEVKATDMFGKSYVTQSSYRIGLPGGKTQE